MASAPKLRIDFGDRVLSRPVAEASSSRSATSSSTLPSSTTDTSYGNEVVGYALDHEERDFSEKDLYGGFDARVGLDAGPDYSQTDDDDEEEEDEEFQEDEDEEEEEFDVDNLFHDPHNLRVEYVGKYRMVIVDLEVDDAFLVPKKDEHDAIPRLVAIDAANVLHGWTPVCIGDSARPDEQKVDAAYILSLVRFFVSKGVECVVVTPHKYMIKDVTENIFILERLKQLGMIVLADRQYDDLVLFSVAGEFDAVILSEDQFRDEQRLGSLNTPDAQRALQLKVSPKYPHKKVDFLSKSDWGKVSRNGHFVVDHLLRFVGSTEQLRNKFFATEERAGFRYELVKQKYETWRKKQPAVLRELDRLLAQIQPIMEEKRMNVPAVVPRPH